MKTTTLEMIISVMIITAFIIVISILYTWLKKKCESQPSKIVGDEPITVIETPLKVKTPPKVNILGEEGPIIFEHLLNQDKEDRFQIEEVSTLTPFEFKFIDLVARNYFPGYDIMFAYNDPLNRGDGYLFLGQFNSGNVVDKSTIDEKRIPRMSLN